MHLGPSAEPGWRSESLYYRDIAREHLISTKSRRKVPLPHAHVDGIPAATCGRTRGPWGGQRVYGVFGWEYWDTSCGRSELTPSTVPRGSEPALTCSLRPLHLPRATGVLCWWWGGGGAAPPERATHRRARGRLLSHTIYCTRITIHVCLLPCPVTGTPRHNPPLLRW